MKIKRNAIRDNSGRVLGYLVNGRILAAAGEYENAIRSLWDIATSQQLTLDIPETDGERDGHDDTGAD